MSSLPAGDARSVPSSSASSSASPSASVPARPQGAVLVGSVALATAAETMSVVAEHLGSHVRRIPDGEVGERFHWILFQGTRFEATSGLVRVPVDPVVVAGFDVRPHVLDGSVAPQDLVFGDLGYAAAAVASYGELVRLRAEGVVAPGTRLQVCLPTPLAPVTAFVVPDAREAVYDAYEAALLRELAAICAHVPAQDLAVQVDLATEFALIEGANLGAGPARAWFDDVVAGCVERAARFASAVPADVELGIHLCYGDVAEKHFVEPADAGRLVEVANGLVRAVTRPVTWFHLPVPVERDDAAYHAPLAGLAIDPDTELYLGLVHHEDGVEGAQRRIDAAAAALGGRPFGVATECGFGRGPGERTGALLDLHAAVARPW